MEQFDHTRNFDDISTFHQNCLVVTRGNDLRTRGVVVAQDLVGPEHVAGCFLPLSLPIFAFSNWSTGTSLITLLFYKNVSI
jgi:hypothetical protein